MSGTEWTSKMFVFSPFPLHLFSSPVLALWAVLNFKNAELGLDMWPKLEQNSWNKTLPTKKQYWHNQWALQHFLTSCLTVSCQNSEQKEKELFILFKIAYYLGTIFTFSVLAFGMSHTAWANLLVPCCPLQSGAQMTSLLSSIYPF